MKKQLLFMFLFVFSASLVAQKTTYWSRFDASKAKIQTNKFVQRVNFPRIYDLYELNFDEVKRVLYSSITSKKVKTLISIPNPYGQIEVFEVFEASNFDEELQARFPEIRAFSGKGITDKTAMLKLSLSPQGIQTMVMRADKPSEFMEPFSSDGKIYSVYYKQGGKGNDWKCHVVEKEILSENEQDYHKSISQPFSSGTTLRTLRLAQSVTGEYSNYFGWTTSAGNINMVITAINNTLTRCNGVYEKDLGLHLTMINQSTNVIFNNATTDPYSPSGTGAGGAWSTELQDTLNTMLSVPTQPQSVNDGLYDIGHLFGRDGGGGSAGCIGCACGTINSAASWTYIGNGKGSGFTSPGSGAPVGDNFDIDYVVHEVGHQLGMNHSFTHSSQVTEAQREVGSGVTIMGYAGITGYDVEPHSIDIYHPYNIWQFETNFADKPCTQVQNVSANNVAPIAYAGADYIIPISTPFVLEASATDANGDTLTYHWDQNDVISGMSGASSPASTTKTAGPNFRSWAPSSSPKRYFPTLTSVIANSATTTAVGTNDATPIRTEALSSVSRDLNFRLTVRDNAPYNPSTPEVAQTHFDDMLVTVSNTSGPFVVNVPSATGLSYVVGTNQNVTWNVASTNTGAVNTPFVDIYLFTDNTLTNGILLASKVPNDGSETITIPNNVGTTHRIMVKGNNNIFFDISNNNFAITAPASSFGVAFNGIAGEQNKGACPGNQATYTFNYTTLSGFSGTTNFTATGVPANTTVSFSPTSRTTTGTVTMTVSTTGTTPVGLANIIVNATSGATTKTIPFYLNVQPTPSAATLTTPANNATLQNTTLNLVWTAGANSTNFDYEVATDSAFTNIIRTGNLTATTINVAGLSQGTDYWWRIRPNNTSCSSVFGAAYKFTTGVVNCSTVSNTTSQTIASTGKPTITSTINIPSGVSITDINLSVNITHAAAGDLILTLAGPTGASAIVLDQSCGTNNDAIATFDDSGSALACGTSPAISGNVIPLNPLTVFNGTNSTGTWTLTVKDNASGNGGMLNSWSLNICNISAPLTNTEFEITDISLFPNPNNGSFNIRFNAISDNIKVLVHDIRGRQIFENNYDNNGTFNQEINLDYIQSGVYLVSIFDGAKKTTKRIIVE